MTMVLSCPEAACLALLAEDAFGFVGLDKTVSQLSITEIKPRGGFTAAAMEDVRTLVFQILRSQDISLSNRLKVIGHFCERLTTLIHTKQAASLPGLLRDIEIDLESGAAMAPWAGMAELPDVQAQFAASFFLKGQEVFQSPHRRRVLFEVAKGLGIQGQTVPDAQTLVHAYEGGLERLAPALAAVPWLLEHFMLNEALREVFPWGEENPMRHYTTLIVRYATARLMLVGRAAAREAPLTPFELAETVQVSCRRYLHDANFTTHAHQVLTEADWDFHKLSALL
jgi:lysine-N-methylase